jgi:hypothetical protein
VKLKVTITLQFPKDMMVFQKQRFANRTANSLYLTIPVRNNIFKTFSDETYKEWFHSRVKKFANGGGQVSIAHYVLSETINTSMNARLGTFFGDWSYFWSSSRLCIAL